MKTINKYQLDQVSIQELMLPYYAEFLCIRVLQGVPFLFVLGDQSFGLLQYTIHTIANNLPIEDSIINNTKYVDTYTFPKGVSTVHVFAGLSQ